MSARIVALISQPEYDPSACLRAASDNGFRFIHIKYWEQFTRIHILNRSEAVVEIMNRPLHTFAAICFAGLPKFATHENTTDKLKQFNESEWAATLTSLLSLSRRPFLNSSPLIRTTSFGFSGTMLLGLLAAAGLPITRRSFEPDEALCTHLLMNCNSYPINSSKNLPDHVLTIIHSLMFDNDLDFLLLNVVDGNSGPVIKDCYILPPSNLSEKLWGRIWYELSI